MNSYIPAVGIEGHLLIYPNVEDVNDINIVFRIYDKEDKRKFKDYEIRHHDLKIKLLDGELWETENGNFIEYPYRLLK